ncbi:MAG: hypothetical protein R2909_14310 [Gemmatimonadales bacterium]
MDLMAMEHPDFVPMDLERSRFVDYSRFGIEHDPDRAAAEYAETLRLIVDFLAYTLEGDARAHERLLTLTADPATRP